MTSILGHVSARIADVDEMWIRCRSPEEEGVRYTTVDAIRRVDFDGKGPHKGKPYQVPNELPIHGEIYKNRPTTSAASFTPIPKKRSFAAAPNFRSPPSLAHFNISGDAHGLRGHPGLSAGISRQPAEFAAIMIEIMSLKSIYLMKGPWDYRHRQDSRRSDGARFELQLTG